MIEEPRLTISRNISHFEILGKLGQGGMGVVYKARDTRLDRLVAIKVLSAESVRNRERQLRFVQEAKAASALNHPNIVTVYEIDTTGELAFIAMEYVEGRTLEQVIRQRGLPIGDALKYAIQIADALAAAHAAGIVHRDVKPANIMVTEKGIVKVLDFGLAKLTENPASASGATLTMHSPQTEEGSILGTVAYMSPEQAQGKKIDARSDIFSFGAVLYEMLTGRHAFVGETKLSTLAAILNQEPKPLTEAEGVPRDLEKIVTRCLRKDPERRLHVIIDVKVGLEEIKEEYESGRIAHGLPLAAKKAVRLRFSAMAAAVFAVLSLAIVGFWWMGQRHESAPGPRLTEITFDSGLSTEPAISPDGKLIAYASDRSGRGDLDIWVQQAAGGAPIRVTDHEADDHEPAFSPDGATIVFRSEREGGGIYIVSALGGDARLVAKSGHDPCFSPDGAQIAYWTGTGVNASTPSQIYVVPVAGGAARGAQSELKWARHPIWTPDGKHLLFWGASDKVIDWWTVELGTESASQPPRPEKTGWSATYGRGDFTGGIYPEGWLDEQVVFAAPFGDTVDLWTIPLSHRTWHVTGPPQRLTAGLELVKHPSGATRGQFVFASLRSEINVWSLPADGNSGRITGDLQQLTYGIPVKNRPALSRNGRKLAFGVGRPAGAVVVQDLGAGKVTRIATAQSWYPSLNTDGSKIAYARMTNERKVQIYVASSAGGVPDKVCEDCGFTPAAWSSNGLKLLYDWGAPQLVGLLDLTTRKKTELLRSPTRAYTQASFSPDDRWICFLAGVEAGRSRVYIIPFREEAVPPPPQANWIPVTDGTALDGQPRWSPNGNMVYFVSDRDGFRCLWAQRLDPDKKLALGPPFAVSHFHKARRSLGNVGNIGLVGLGVSQERIVLNIGDLTGNVWMAQMAGSK